MGLSIHVDIFSFIVDNDKNEAGIFFFQKHYLFSSSSKNIL
jgi:hypothetical protein